MDNGNNFNNQALTKPKNNKNKIIILIIAIVIVVLVGIGVGAYAIINNNPKVKVLKGIKMTSEELKDKQTLTEKIVGEDYFKDLEENGSKQKMQFALNATSYPELSQFNGAGISINSSCDMKNKVLMFDIGGQYKGTNLLDAQFYTDNKKLMISVPKMYNAWFTCDAENIQDQYNNSYFASTGQLINKELSLKLFDDNKVLSGKELVDAVVKGYMETNKAKLEELGKNMKVEKSKKTKNIEIAGASQECTGYDVVISGQDAKVLVESIYDYLLEDEEVKKVIVESAKYSYLQEDKYNSPEDMVDDIYKELKDANEKFKKSVTFDDVNTVVYLDKKGRAVSIELNSAINIDGKKTDVNYSIEFKGEDNLGDILKMSTELKDGSESFKIDLDNSTTTKDDVINEDMKLAFSSDKAPVNITVKSEYNTKNGDFDASADLSADGESLSIGGKGNVNFDKSNKKLELDFDDINLKSNINSEQINISLDGSYEISPLDDAIKEPSGEKLEVFKLSEDKVAEIAQDMQRNAMQVAGEFYR